MDIESNIMDTESNIIDTATTDAYRPGTLISVHTGRPIDETPNIIDTTTKFYRRNFWCEICHVKLLGVITALCHLRGKAHKRKLNTAGDEIRNNTLKRKLNDSLDVNLENDVEGAQIKKSKKQTSEIENVDVELLKCEMCAREFPSLLVAVEHFKGKKHMSKIEFQHVADMKCEDCNLQFATAILAVKHFKGKKHVSKILSNFHEKTGDGAEVNARNKPKQTDVPTDLTECELCECKFKCTGDAVRQAIIAVQHFKGKKHVSKTLSFFREKTGGGAEVKARNKQKQTDVPTDLTECELCECSFTCSANAVQHFTGRRHVKVALSNVNEENNSVHVVEQPLEAEYGVEGEGKANAFLQNDVEETNDLQFTED